MIRVSIVDDHPVVRDGVRSVLETQDDLEVCETAPSDDKLDPSTVPDVVVLDWELQGHGGSSAIRSTLQRFPNAKIAIFSGYAGDERVGAALSAGARAYVLKGSPGSELITAIRSIAAGGTYLGSGVTAPSIDARDQLTKREIEVLQLVAAGLSNDEIAKRLRLAERTVKFHMNAVFGKLGASRRTQAVAIAKERGLF